MSINMALIVLKEFSNDNYDSRATLRIERSNTVSMIQLECIKSLRIHIHLS